MEKNQQVIENAVEIAMNNLRELQNTVDMGRDRLISDFILKWAEEAEPEYQRVVKENGGEYPYYDFIDEFSEKKMVEVRELCRKGTLPTVPSANTVREDFNSELKHIRSFSEKCLEDIKAIVMEQPNQKLEIPFNLTAAYLLIQDNTYDDGLMEDRVRTLLIDGEGGLVFECNCGTYHECDTAYPDIVYPYLLDTVYETLESMDKTK